MLFFPFFFNFMSCKVLCVINILYYVFGIAFFVIS